MSGGLPAALAKWREAPRARRLNDRAVGEGGYVLCWLQQALRADDNPVVDAAIRLGNALGLPVLVYHGVREDYPYASDRLHRFILGASRDLKRDADARGLACVQYVDRADKREKGLVHRLGAGAAAIVVDDQSVFVARAQAASVAARASVAVFAVEAACLVPPAVIGAGIGSRTGYGRARRTVVRSASRPSKPGSAKWAKPVSSVAPALTA
ncbi:deoxyribodipyrimidine photo-lyase, partial [Sphingomonas bacterium]|uniref:deoxyribodipyrimidine photo-lyase n=1 Tax=Sphingomonas bacterium TaxID=1895847 RepID=UPI0020C69F0A